MSAGHVPVPILLGAVRCIGCEATPPPSGSVRVEDEAHYEYMIGSGPTYTASSKEAARAALARKAYAAVGKSCGGELRVLRLDASAFSVYALAFAMYKVQIHLFAIPTVVPAVVCVPPTPPAGEPDREGGK